MLKVFVYTLYQFISSSMSMFNNDNDIVIVYVHTVY